MSLIQLTRIMLHEWLCFGGSYEGCLGCRKSKYSSSETDCKYLLYCYELSQDMMAGGQNKSILTYRIVSHQVTMCLPAAVI